MSRKGTRNGEFDGRRGGAMGHVSRWRSIKVGDSLSSDKHGEPAMISRVSGGSRRPRGSLGYLAAPAMALPPMKSSEVRSWSVNLSAAPAKKSRPKDQVERSSPVTESP